MHYDAIEIGSCDFDTCLDTLGEGQKAIIVEPVFDYLNKLPQREGVTYLHLAISKDNVTRKRDIYYIPEERIEAHGLPGWLKGCNSVGGYHYQHKERGLQQLVNIDTVLALPLSYLFSMFMVSSLHLLKIDAEGDDCFIVQHLINFLSLQKEKAAWPHTLQFETNELSPLDLIENTVQLLRNKGYEGEIAHPNTIMLRK